ncbi:MAG TPA: mechanosensitive ion channel domain-containing protein [Usitatibacter sp.]|nr:mechanosensitive ion channel domain-containing protein [Usitatibacter sp.]
MDLTLEKSLLRRVIANLTEGANTNEIVVQIAVAAAAIGVAFFIASFICGRTKLSSRWKFGKGDFENVAFALLSVAFVWIGKRVLANFQEGDGGPIEIILTLLVAWAVIRLAGYVLGHVIHEGGFQRGVIRIVTIVAWLGVLLHVTGLLPDVMYFLDAHGMAIGKNKTEVTLLDVAKGIAALFFAIVFALWLGRVTEGRVMASETMEMTTRVVISKVVKIGVLFLAIFVALPVAGIDITTLSIFGGALGVGLGFGMQKIASNYVSGFIVLLDRSLRIGDFVTIDNKRGEVKAIETRYTVIQGADGVESIIPNEKLITESVNHHTYSDPKISMVMTVTISYESDVDRACEILGELAKSQPRVIDQPPSAARVRQLTDHGIELELTVWIKDPHVGEGDLKSDLFKAMLRAFREQGIVIPYPRREVRMLATGEMQETRAQSTG